MIEKLTRRSPIGRPHHGLVQGGVLTLPNGATMAHTQPADGTVRTLHPPMAPGWSGDAGAVADELAAGRVWLDYLVVSGSDNVVYGEPLGALSWLYASADGKCWKVTLDAYGDPCTLTIARWGAFGPAPDSDTRSVAWPASFDPESGYSLHQVYASYVFQSLGDVSVRLVDWSDTGARAVFGFYREIVFYDAPIGHEGMYEPIPVGFFEVRLSNGGTAAGVHAEIVTMATPAICMPTVTGVPTDTGFVLPGIDGHEEVFQTLTDRIVAYWYAGEVALPVKCSVTRRKESTVAVDGPVSCSGAELAATASQSTEASVTLSWSGHTSTFSVVVDTTRTRTMSSGDGSGDYTDTTDNDYEVTAGPVHLHATSTDVDTGNCYDGERTAVATVSSTPMAHAVKQSSTPLTTDPEALYEWPPGLMSFAPLAPVTASTLFLPRLSTCGNRRFIALIGETQEGTEISGTPTTNDETIILATLTPTGPATELHGFTFGVLVGAKLLNVTHDLLTSTHIADDTSVAFV